jgi:hypothetical protein
MAIRRRFLFLLVALGGIAASQSVERAPAVFGQSHEPLRAVVTTDEAAVLWRDPGQIETLDFADGPVGAQGKPKAPFQFVDESLSGSSAKIRVVDSNGIRWMVKFGEEVRAQTFAARLAGALGYFALPMYFIPSGTVIGVTPLKRAAKYVKPDGRFTNASFALYLDSSIRWLSDTQSWSWNANPFVGSHQLNGLKILLMLLSNWDNKDARDLKYGSNTTILVYPGGEARYLVIDWGGSMGTWGGYLDRSKWNCVGFELQTPDFVKAAHGHALQWGYLGQHTEDFTEGIHLDDVRWLLRYLGRISDAQLRDGLLSSGATPAETHCFATALRKRIAALQTVD